MGSNPIAPILDDPSLIKISPIIVVKSPPPSPSPSPQPPPTTTAQPQPTTTTTTTTTTTVTTAAWVPTTAADVSPTANPTTNVDVVVQTTAAQPVDPGSGGSVSTVAGGNSGGGASNGSSGSSGNPGGNTPGSNSGKLSPPGIPGSAAGAAQPSNASASNSALSPGAAAAISIGALLCLALAALAFAVWRKKQKGERLPRHQQETLGPQSDFFASIAVRSKKSTGSQPAASPGTSPIPLSLVINPTNVSTSPISSANTLSDAQPVPEIQKKDSLFSNMQQNLENLPTDKDASKVSKTSQEGDGLFDQMRIAVESTTTTPDNNVKRTDAGNGSSSATLSKQESNPFNAILNSLAKPALQATTAMRLKSKAFFSRDGPNTRADPSSPEEWSVEEAAAWVNVNGGGVEGSATVLDQEINGRVLTTVPVEELLSVIRCKTLGERVKLRDALVILRGSVLGEVEEGFDSGSAPLASRIAPPKYEDTS